MLKNFIEIGPEKVLSGMVKRTIKDINCFSINSIDDMKKIKMNLKIKNNYHRSDWGIGKVW